MTDPAHEIIDQVLLQLASQDSAAARKLERLIARKRPALLVLVKTLLAQQAAAPAAPLVAPPAQAPATAADPWASQHRGWKITPAAGAGGAARIIKGYDVHDPQGGPTFAGSIKDAKKFIDEALASRQDSPRAAPPTSPAPPASRRSSRFDPETLSVWVNEVPAHLDAALQAIVRDTVSDYVKPALRLELLAAALAHGVNEAVLQDLSPPVEFNITLPYVRGSLQVVRVGVQLDPGGEVQVRTLSRKFPGLGSAVQRSAVKPHELDLRAGSASASESAATAPSMPQAPPAPRPGHVPTLDQVWAAAKAARSPQQYFWDLLAHEDDLPRLQERLRQVGEPADLASARSFQEESEREQIEEGLGETGQGRPDQAKLEYILGQQREAFRYQNPQLVLLVAGIEPGRLPSSQAERDADLQLAQTLLAKAAALQATKPSPSAPPTHPEPLAISIKGVAVHLDEPLQAIVREDASEYITPAIRLEKLAQSIGYGVDDAIRARLSPPVDFNITLPYRRLLERVVRVRLQYVPGGDIQVSLVQEQILRPGDAKAHGLDLRASPGAPAAPPLEDVPAGGPHGLLEQIAQVQQAGQLAVFIGVSHHLDHEWAKAAGVRLGDLLISYPDSDEAAIEIAETQLRTGAVALVAIDAEGAQAAQLRKVLGRHGTAVAVGSQSPPSESPVQDVPVQDVPVPDVPVQDVPVQDVDDEEEEAQASPDDTDTWTSNHLAYQGALLAQRDRGKGRARRLQAYGVGGVATKQRLSDLTPDEQQALMAAYSTAYDAPEPPPEPVRRSLGREDYQDRQAARQERLEGAADKASAEASGRFARADQISQRFYMGQPILVGHHSEQGARRDQERMHDSMRAGIDAQDRAKELAGRAASVGTAGISSDDPEALGQLRDKLANLEKRRDSLKAVNAAYRKGGWEAVAQLPNMAMTPEGIAEHKKTMAATPWAKMPIEAYVLSNLGANIRTVKQRIENLEKETRRDGMPEIVGHGWRIEERPDINRVAVSFDKKPPKAVLELLRGWNYSPTEKASLRLNNPAGRSAARYLAEQLAPHYPAPQI